MKKFYFKSIWNMNSGNENVEKIYIEKINTNLIKYTKYIILIPLLLNVFEMIYLFINSVQKKILFGLVLSNMCL